MCEREQAFCGIAGRSTLIKNTPFTRQIRVAEFSGLLIMFLVTGTLAFFGTGILISPLVGFTIGIVATVIVVRDYQEDR